MTAHTRPTGLAPATTNRASTSRLVLVAGGVLLQAVIVLGFLASSLGFGGAAYPDPGPGRLAPPARVAPVSAIEANRALVLEPAPAPAPAP